MNVVFFVLIKIEISSNQFRIFQFLFGYLIVNMSVKTSLNSESKAIALNVLKICREEKQNGELFLPLSSHLARASVLIGVQERSLVRFPSSNLQEKSCRKVRKDKLNVDDFD